MTYEEYKQINDKIKTQISQIEMYKPTFLRIVSVDLTKDACMLSNGTRTTITTLVRNILSGKGCVANPSVLKKWKGFSDIELTEYKQSILKYIPNIYTEPNTLNAMAQLLDSIFATNTSISEALDGFLFNIKDTKGFLTMKSKTSCYIYIEQESSEKPYYLYLGPTYDFDRILIEPMAFLDFIDKIAELLYKKYHLKCIYKNKQYIWINKDNGKVIKQL